ncbi:MAG: RNA polymerase factor sigma-54 [Planctomycetota bacterium]|jgi:RNA polymerase sigma-54 factor
MRLDVSQSFRLEQRMKLSPRIIQAMEILQLPLLALQERIEQELASNPCLEQMEGSGDPDMPVEAPEESHERGEEDMVVGADKDNTDDFERLADFDEVYAEELDWSDRPSRAVSAGGERDAKMDALANTAAPSQSLSDYLMQQWAFVEAPDEVKRAGQALIQNIDEDGYLRDPPAELVRQENPPITEPALAEALPMVQALDPPGVGARDLRESLLLQLDAEAAAGKDVALARRLVADFHREIELNHIPQIARRTGRSVGQINEALAHLGRLDPHPGRLIGDHPVPYIVPDAIVDVDEDGNVVVVMRDGDGPALRISRLYRSMARQRQTDSDAREFLRKNLRSAQWLIGAIAQRRRTVRRVIEEVFAAQKEFLERGREALRPLPMTDVARKVGVHVATVSRAVSGKYVQTPRGIFPLRMFFSGGKTTADGQDVAWDAIKVKLKEIVDGEDKTRPLNDDKIAEALAAAGVRIARRTVAKYRNLLNIPPARQRKQY